MVSEEAKIDLATLLYKDGGLVLGNDRPDGGGEGGEEEEVEEDQGGHHLGLEEQQDVLGVGDRGNHLGAWVGKGEEVVRVFFLSHYINLNAPIFEGLNNQHNPALCKITAIPLSVVGSRSVIIKEVVIRDWGESNVHITYLSRRAPS